MGTLKNELNYRCFNDCKQSSCPSHKMSLTIQTTSEALMVYIDDKLWFSAEPNEWEALKILLTRTPYNFFDLEKPNNN